LKPHQILSRRRSESKVNFAPDNPRGNSPFAQLRRFAALLEQQSAPAEDFEDMEEVLSAYQEFLYRKIFTGVSHEDYLATPTDVVQWLIAVSVVDNDAFRNSKKSQ
jgi:hypothetical protein